MGKGQERWQGLSIRLWAQIVSNGLFVVAASALTPVGLSSAQTCAAIRAGISAYANSGFVLQGAGWEPAIAATLPISPKPNLSKPKGRFSALALAALAQCIDESMFKPSSTSLLMGIPEKVRLDQFKRWYSEDIEEYLRDQLLAEFHSTSRLISQGNVSVLAALQIASRLIESGEVRQCIVGGVDSLVNEADIVRLEDMWRLHCEDMPQGVVPGEAATFLAVEAARTGRELCRISGIGIDQEDVNSSVLSDGHPTGKGLERALRKATADAGVDESEIGLRLSDLNGERYGAMDSMLALSRFYRTDRDGLPIWHPADCVGETGAAVGALLIQIGGHAKTLGYAPPGAIMCELSSESGLRAACVIHSSKG